MIRQSEKPRPETNGNHTKLMDLTILIVNWNTRDLLVECLNSIQENLAAAPALQAETFIIDNASSDDSVSVIKNQFSWIKLIENHQNVGFAKANNQGIKVSKGRYLLLLNSDALLFENTIKEMINFADNQNEVAVVGSMWLNPDGSFQASYNDFPKLFPECMPPLGIAKIFYSPFFPSYPPEESKKIKRCDWVGGACMLVRKSAIDEVGLLDENYFMYVEEADWCYRMVKAGWEVVYLPQAKVIHLGGQSADRISLQQQIRLYHSKYYFFLNHCGFLEGKFFKCFIHFSALIKSCYWLIRGLIMQNPTIEIREKSKIYWQVAISREI